ATDAKEKKVLEKREIQKQQFAENTLKAAERADEHSKTSANEAHLAVNGLVQITDSERVLRDQTWRLRHPFGSWQGFFQVRLQEEIDGNQATGGTWAKRLLAYAQTHKPEGREFFDPFGNIAKDSELFPTKEEFSLLQELQKIDSFTTVVYDPKLRTAHPG